MAMNLFGRVLDRNHHPLIVAEISCNHAGSLMKAKDLIVYAREFGADAVKIQVYDADDMTWKPKWLHEGYTPLKQQGGDDFFVKQGPWKDEYLWNLYNKTQTPYEWIPELFAHAELFKIPLFASVFSLKGLALLEKLNCSVYKIASFELVDIPLIKQVAKTGKTVILSTGMANLTEIHEAFECCDPKNTVLMHCVSSYPTKLNEANLWKLDKLKSFFNVPVGFSDHTLDNLVAQLAVAKGACIIEKHLMMEDDERTEDERFSLTGPEFQRFANSCRRASEASFNVRVGGEEASKQFRRSIYVSSDVQKGEIISSDKIRIIRPSYGLPPNMYNIVLGAKAKCDIKAGTALKMEHLEK